MVLTGRLIEQLWLRVNQQGSCRACSCLMLVHLTFLQLLLIPSHADTLVLNFGRNEGFTLECSNNFLCINGSAIYVLLSGTQVLIDGTPTCDVAIRNSISLAIQSHLNNVCTSANETSKYALNLSNLSYLSNCSGVTSSANVSFQAYYNCTSTKPTAFVTALPSEAILPASVHTRETTSDSGKTLSSQAGGTTTNNASTNAGQSATEQDRRLTTILASVIPVILVLGAVAVTIGVLARKTGINARKILASLRRRGGSVSFDSDPPFTRRSSEPESVLTYASLNELGVERDDHIYADAVQRSYSSRSDAGEPVYENGPVHLPS